MSRLFHVFPSWRASLLLAFACFVVADGAGATIDGPRAIADQHVQRRSDPDQRSSDPDQRARDPEERVAGGDEDNNGEGARGAGATTLLLTPSRLDVAVGSRFRMTLSVLGAEDLRRLPVTIRFDPDVVALISASLGAAFDDRRAPVFLHDASRPGELIVGIAQLDRHGPGLFGAAEVLELEFEARSAGDARMALDRFAAIGGPGAAEAVAIAAEIVVR